MAGAKARLASKSQSPAASAILVAAFAYEAWFFAVAGHGGAEALGGAVWALFCAAVFAVIAFRGQSFPARRVFFFTSALAFIPSFVMNLVEERGRMALTGADIIARKLPFCHIAITTSILPAVLGRTLDFPARLSGSRSAFYPMLAYWLLSLVTIGRGWCSWVCFYGGLEDGLCALPRKARLGLGLAGAKMRRGNYAILAFVALAGIGTLVPVYCEWLCPFKLVTEYAAPVDLRSFLALIAFVGLFLGLVVVLPLLTKKRTQCSILCPFGAMQSLLDRLSPFRVEIDMAACVSCGACDRACPMSALGSESRRSGRPESSCVKCGDCFAACPRGAIGYSARGSARGADSLERIEARLRASSLPIAKLAGAAIGVLRALLSPSLLFPFTALSFGMIISTGFSSQTLTRLVNLAMGLGFSAGAGK